MDAEDLTWEGMRQGVLNSDIFVLFLTNSMLSRKFCLYEISWAIEFEKPIVAVAERDGRFWSWDLARWKSDECARDRLTMAWSRIHPLPAQLKSIDELQVRHHELEQSAECWPHADEIKTAIERLAPGAVPYCRRKFEAAAMVREILLRGFPAWGGHLPVSTDEQQLMRSVRGTKIMVVAGDPATSTAMCAALESLGGGRVTCVIDEPVAAETRAVVVLSPALLAEGSTALALLDDLARQNDAQLCQIVFLYEVCAECGVSWDHCTHGSWKFSMKDTDYMKTHHLAVKEMVESHEAIPYRPEKGYARRAMAVETLRRLKLPIAPDKGASEAPPVPPRPRNEPGGAAAPPTFSAEPPIRPSQAAPRSHYSIDARDIL